MCSFVTCHTIFPMDVKLVYGNFLGHLYWNAQNKTSFICVSLRIMGGTNNIMDGYGAVETLPYLFSSVIGIHSFTCTFFFNFFKLAVMFILCIGAEKRAHGILTDIWI